MVLEVSQLWGLFCSLKLFAQLNCIQKPPLVPRRKRPRVFTCIGKDFCLCVGWLKIRAVVLPDFQHAVTMQWHICSDWTDRRATHEMATILVAASKFFQNAFLGQKQKLAGMREMEFRGRMSKLVKVKWTGEMALLFDTPQSLIHQTWNISGDAIISLSERLSFFFFLI